MGIYVHLYNDKIKLLRNRGVEKNYHHFIFDFGDRKKWHTVLQYILKRIIMHYTNNFQILVSYYTIFCLLYVKCGFTTKEKFTTPVANCK